MNGWERWIIYPLCIICTIICLCNMSWRIGADKSGFVVGVLAVLVTALVGWQIWQSVNARQELRATRDDIRREHELEIQEIRRGVETDRQLNQEFRDNLESRIDERINNRIHDYDRAVTAATQLCLARAPLAAHQVMEFVNEQLGTHRTTNLLHSAFSIITLALRNINDCTIKDNLDELYIGLSAILDMVDRDLKQYAVIQPETIDGLIDEVKREQRISNADRNNVLSRLNRLRAILTGLNDVDVSEIVSRNHNGVN